MSSRQDIVARHLQKAAAQQAAAAGASALEEKAISESGRENEVAEETPVASPLKETTDEVSPQVKDKRKRIRSDDMVVKTYVPQWGVLENHALVSSAPWPARDIGPDLSRGLIMSADRPRYDKVDHVGTCTEMLSLLSMVNFFLKLSPSFCSIGFLIFAFVLF